ncbi:MAG: cytochrome c maturation protein CcmE [Chloroherpetonaceae bacterium]|jgi:cytochrome c-type biogenesis protein CcmE
MKTKYIIIGVVSIVFLLLAVFSFSANKIDYADFQVAKQNGKTVQIIGQVEDAKESTYNPSQNMLVFNLTDEKDNTEKVYFTGPKPNNFDIAPMVVIKGKYQDGKFVASEILTKCPSKYESKFDEKVGSKI